MRPGCCGRCGSAADTPGAAILWEAASEGRGSGGRREPADLQGRHAGGGGFGAAGTLCRLWVIQIVWQQEAGVIFMTMQATGFSSNLPRFAGRTLNLRSFLEERSGWLIRRTTAIRKNMSGSRWKARSARSGITDYAQNSLGDIVYVDAPKVGDAVTANQTFGSVESVKAVSDLFSPVSGTVTAVNEALKTEPDKINAAAARDMDHQGGAVGPGGVGQAAGCGGVRGVCCGRNRS